MPHSLINGLRTVDYGRWSTRPSDCGRLRIQGGILCNGFAGAILNVRRSYAELIRVAHRYGRKVGTCGQAPSDYPEFASFLVDEGIDSLRLNPDALLRTTVQISQIEQTQEKVLA